VYEKILGIFEALLLQKEFILPSHGQLEYRNLGWN
jgi:hypothetical protein